MAWRMVMRRAGGRSMTVVGDIAQTGAAAGARSWADVLEPHVPGRWRQESLTVNYRTPSEVMELAARVLHTIDPALEPPASVRSTGENPRVVPVWSSLDLVDQLAKEVSAELREVGSGRLAVLAPAARLDDVHGGLSEALPVPVSRATTTDALDAPVTVLTAGQAKGLEFDTVVVVEPAELLAESLRGATDLYVAVTRPTQRLVLLHAEPLPPMLA